MDIKIKLAKAFQAFRKCRAGATAIEYGLIAALVALSIIPATKVLSKRVHDNNTCLRQLVTKNNFKDDGLGPCAPFESVKR